MSLSHRFPLLARGLAWRSPTVQSLRSLRTSAAKLSYNRPSNRHKSPSLADVTPDSVTTYKSNLAAFRDRKSTSLAGPTTELSPPAGTGNKNNSTTFLSASNLTSSPNRLVKSLLYGSPAGQKEEQEMEQSYGKVLARGKYVHEIVLHKVKPDRVGEYVELIGEEYPRIAEEKENNVHLVGSWKVEIGETDSFGKSNLVTR